MQSSGSIFNAYETAFATGEDALPDEYRFNRVRMEYKKQVKPGEQVIPVRYDLPDGKTVIDLRSGESSCAAAEFSTVAFRKTF